MLSHRDRARLFLEDSGKRDWGADYLAKLADVIAQAVEAEREVCAKIADATAPRLEPELIDEGDWIAQCIRARGNS